MLFQEVVQRNTGLPVHTGVSFEPLDRIRAGTVQFKGFQDIVTFLRMQFAVDIAGIGLSMEAERITTCEDLNEALPIVASNNIPVDGDLVSED